MRSELLLAVVALACVDGCALTSTEPASNTTTQASTTNGQSIYLAGTMPLGSTISNSNNTASALELSVGGSSQTGVAQTLIGTYDAETNTFSSISDGAGGNIALPVGLVEPEVSEIPGTSTSTTHYYLVVNGREARDGAARSQVIGGTTFGYSYVIKLTLNGSSQIVSGVVTEVTGARLGTPRVMTYRSLKPCGTGSRLIALAGIQDKGFYDVANVTTTDKIDVFTFNAGSNGGNSTWAPLQDASSNTIVLQTTRGYHEVLDKANAHTTFYIPGGMKNGNKAIKTTEKLVVDNNCVATNADASHKVPLLSGGDMPAERARMASIAVQTDSFSINGGTARAYEFALATGNDTTDVRPTGVFLFDVDAEVWGSVGTIQEGKIFGRFSRRPGATSVKLAQGLKTDGATPVVDFYKNTSTLVDVFTDNSGASHTWSTGTALANGLIGAAQDSLDDGTGLKDFTGFGGTHVATAGAAPNPSAMQTSYVTF